MDEGDLAVDALDYGMQTEAGDDGDARRDLGEAVDIIGRLRDENETFRANFEQLKAAHMQLQTRHAEVRKQLAEAVDANRRLETTHTEIVQHIEEQLEARERECSELREAVMPGRELERMRLKVASELDREFQRKLREAADENERLRAAAAVLRRENEMLKAAAEAQHSDEEKRVQEFDSKLRGALALADARGKAQRSAADEAAASEKRAQQLRRDVSQLQEHEKRLLEEVNELQARVEKAHKESQSSTAALEKQISDERAGVRALQSEKEALQRKAADLEQQLLEANLARGQLVQRVALLEQQQEQNRARFSSTTQALQAEMESAGTRFAEEKARWRQERDALLKQITESRMRYDEAMRRDQARATEQLARERNALEAMRTARDEALALVSSLKLQNSDVERRALKATQDAAEASDDTKRRLEAVTEETLQLRKRAQELAVAVNLLEERVHASAADADEARRELRHKDQQLAGVVAEGIAMQDRVRELTAQLGDQNAMAADLERESATRRELESSLDSLQRDQRDMERENRRLSRKLRSSLDRAARLETEQSMLLGTRKTGSAASPHRSRQPEAATEDLLSD